MSPKGKGSQNRRRARRSGAGGSRSAPDSAALVAAVPEPEPLVELPGTPLPLSERFAAWDSAEADSRVREWADATIAPTEEYAGAFLVSGEDFDDHRLQFADVSEGKLVAVWRGVVACAGALQAGTFDHLPDEEVPVAKRMVEHYYDQARSNFDDPDIVVPWANGKAGAAEAALALVHAEFGKPTADTQDAWEERLVHWLAQLQPAEELPEADEVPSVPASTDEPDERDGVLAPDETIHLTTQLATGSQLGIGRPVTAAARIMMLPFVFTDVESVEEALGTSDEAMVDLGRQVLEGLRAASELAPEHEPSDVAPPTQPSPQITDPPEAAVSGMRWVATLCPEGVITDDGRAFAPGSIDWRELPLTLMAMIETSEGGHVGAVVAGRIDSIYRAGNLIRAEGVFDESEYGQEIARMVADGTLRGVSVDLAVHEYEMGSRSVYFDDDGNWIYDESEPASEEGPTLLDVLFGGEDEDTVFVVTKGTIGMATACPFQAFADATIEVAASLVAGASPALWTATGQAGWVVVDHHEYGPLTASALGLAPVQPPAAWFDDPELDELTPVTVTEDGRIFGHAWAWETCHTGIPEVCTTAPHSHADYRYFMLGEILCDDGSRVAVGKLTLGTGHADLRANASQTVAHYDNSGTVAAHITVGEDEFGGWIAGAISPDLTDEQVRVLRGSVPSGDWRGIEGNRELVALLAVNVPGFPVPRVKALVAAAEDGETEVLSLVAAGIHNGEATALSARDLAQIGVLADIAAGEYDALAEQAREA